MEPLSENFSEVWSVLLKRWYRRSSDLHGDSRRTRYDWSCQFRWGPVDVVALCWSFWMAMRPHVRRMKSLLSWIESTRGTHRRSYWMRHPSKSILVYFQWAPDAIHSLHRYRRRSATTKTVMLVRPRYRRRRITSMEENYHFIFIRPARCLQWYFKQLYLTRPASLLRIIERGERLVKTFLFSSTIVLSIKYMTSMLWAYVFMINNMDALV